MYKFEDMQLIDTMFDEPKMVVATFNDALRDEYHARVTAKLNFAEAVLDVMQSHTRDVSDISDFFYELEAAYARYFREARQNVPVQHTKS